MATMCMKCGEQPKHLPKHKCLECLQTALPMDTQVALARDRRTEAIESGLDKDRVARELWPEGRRWCAGCYSFRRYDRPREGKKFDVSPGHSRCRACEVASKGLRNFGLTAELDEALGVTCNICGRSQRTKALAKDHDHVTGKLRGKLCYWCNHQIIGPAEARGNPLAYFRLVVKYLENPPAQQLTDSPPGVE